MFGRLKERTQRGGKSAWNIVPSAGACQSGVMEKNKGRVSNPSFLRNLEYPISLTSQRTSKSTRSRDRNSEYGTSHSARVDCRPVDRSLDIFVIGADHACGALAPDFDLRLDAFWSELLYVVGVSLQNVVGILVRHQPHGNFRRSFRRNDRLRSWSNEAPGHPVHLERRPCPRAVKH